MIKPTKHSSICMTPNCEDEATASRGMCPNCYTAARKLINEGTTDWEQLVSLGLAMDKVNKQSRFREAFFKAVSNKASKRKPVQKGSRSAR